MLAFTSSLSASQVLRPSEIVSLAIALCNPTRTVRPLFAQATPLHLHCTLWSSSCLLSPNLNPKSTHYPAQSAHVLPAVSRTAALLPTLCLYILLRPQPATHRKPSSQSDSLRRKITTCQAQPRCAGAPVQHVEPALALRPWPFGAACASPPAQALSRAPTRAP
jgi:predicted component of type VI protein secretion system